MNKLRKLLTVLLCFCMSCYALPGFASISSFEESEEITVNLSDAEMNEIVGGNGSVDANLSDYKAVGGPATATFTNRTAMYSKYSLDATGINGNVIEVLASGTLAPGEVILATGTPTESANTIMARIYIEGVPGLKSQDFSIRK